MRRALHALVMSCSCAALGGTLLLAGCRGPVPAAEHGVARIVYKQLVAVSRAAEDDEEPTWRRSAWTHERRHGYARYAPEPAEPTRTDVPPASWVAAFPAPDDAEPRAPAARSAPPAREEAAPSPAPAQAAPAEPAYAEEPEPPPQQIVVVSPPADEGYGYGAGGVVEVPVPVGVAVPVGVPVPLPVGGVNASPPAPNVTVVVGGYGAPTTRTVEPSHVPARPHVVSSPPAHGGRRR